MVEEISCSYVWCLVSVCLIISNLEGHLGMLRKVVWVVSIFVALVSLRIALSRIIHATKC